MRNSLQFVTENPLHKLYITHYLLQHWKNDKVCAVSRDANRRLLPNLNV